MGKRSKPAAQPPVRLLVLSDLHLEFHADGGRGFLRSRPPDHADVLVIAGDLTLGSRLSRVLPVLCSMYPEVVYVVGNHEYYGSSSAAVHKALEKLEQAHGNLHWLHHSTKVVQGLRFAGTPLWFRDTPDARLLRGVLNDFSMIRGFVPWVFEENARALAFLKTALPTADVVVTHHMPVAQAVAARFRGERSNCYFLCDVQQELAAAQVAKGGGPKLWICGHTHDSVDVEVGSTRVLCNPLGYPHEANVGFDGRLFVDVVPRR